MVFALDQTNSVASRFLAELRDTEIQKDSLRFRKNLERLGEVLAYELSKSLEYKPVHITTPLGAKQSVELSSKLVLISILRASLPFYNGFLNVFSEAESAFIGAFRANEASNAKDQRIELNYIASPDTDGKELILIDPMLATGNSILKVIEEISSYGKAKKIHVCSTVSSPEGIKALQQKHPDISIWTGSVDDGLNEKQYIIPGLGDAGDLAFGKKS